MEEEKETEIEEKNLANFLSLSYGIIEAFKFVGVLHLGYFLNPILCKLEYLN
jgi:hypothetical protein